MMNASPTTSKTHTTMEETHRRTWYLRVGFVLSLFAAALVCGVVTYVVVDNLEKNLGVYTYESIAVSALEGAQGITLRKLQSGEVMGSMMSYAYPNAEQWPYVAPYGYADTASKIAKITSSMSMAIIVLVQPDQVETFEAHAEQFYRDHDYPRGAGHSDFGFGIWKKDPNETYRDNRLPDTSVETNYESKHNLLAPILLHNKYNASSLMYNVHSNIFRGNAIDSMLDCNADSNEPTPSCSVVTDFVELIVNPGQPAALIYSPVYAANDPDTIVGMTGASLNWREVLTNVVPDYVDGMDCVLSTDTGTYTYSIHQGVPELKGEGDQHDTKYDHLGRSTVLNDIETGATASKTYTLTVYPTSLMLDTFRTNSPLTIALGFVGVILLCASVFLCYDFFMRGESRQNKAILEMKRRFVRFVSHEIRTPLNTVCMGLELLRAELGSQMEATKKGGTAGEHHVMTLSKQDGQSDEDTFSYLMDLTGDILDNSESAVTILNDLLNYDKIETGTFQLEIGLVPIWDLVRKTVSSFDIQARKRNVALNFTMEQSQTNADSDVEQQTTPDFALLNVVGDDMRLRQVILNVVSNALKFVKENDGVIDVTASYHPNGLPGNRPLYTSKAGGGQEAEPISFPRKGSVRISVGDNGEGMTEEQLILLFREGVQFDANKLQHGGGSGLGLYITKGLVEQHGGTISVQSEGRKCGTTFTIELPIYCCQGPTDPDYTSSSSDAQSSVHAQSPVNPGVKCLPAANSSGQPASSSTKEQHRRILVVDDAAMNRKMLMRLLDFAGHSCDSATNGQEAVDAVLADQEKANTDQNHIPYDTILMDFEMPVMDGPEATSRIRGHGCPAFIVGVTGNVLLEDVNFFKSKGADLVLAKPINVKALDEAWRKHKR